MNILITGCASHIAKSCVPVLLEDPRIKKIIGIDLKPSQLDHPQYEEHIVDIRSESIAQYFADIDVVIHLAFVVNNGLLGTQRLDREYIKDININGSKNIFQSAASQQAKAIIHFSSAIVYGMSLDNPAFIEETQEIKSIKDFYYSEDKVAVERYLDDFEKQNSNLRVVRLRPHVVLGQNTQPLIKSMLKQPFHFLLPDPQPLTQCISEMDIATATLQSIFSEANGSFNLACDQVDSFHWIHKHLHRFSLPVPYRVAKQCHRLAWRYSGKWGDPAWFECMQYPLTLSNEKAKKELHWAPTLNLIECLDATL